MKRRTALRIAIAASVALAAPSRARAADLRIAAPPTDGSGEYLYAQAEGFFKKAGLDVQMTTLANGEAVTDGVIGGSLDIGCGQAISLITAFAKGIPLTVVAAAGLNATKLGTGTAGAFFVPNDSTARTGKDFNGKTVGVQGLRGYAQYGTMNWLDKTGGDSSTVHFLEMSSAVMGPALAQHRLDGAFIPEPNVNQVAAYAKKIATPMDLVAPAFYSGSHFAMLAWAKANVDLVRRFSAVMYQTAAWANANQNTTADILAGAMHLDPEIVHRSERTPYATSADPALMQPMIDLAVKYGGIKPYSADELFFKA